MIQNSMKGCVKLKKLWLLLVLILILLKNVVFAESDHMGFVISPSIHGYKVAGTPDQYYTRNNRVWGNILDAENKPALEQEWLLEYLGNIEGCEDIILVIDPEDELYGFFDTQSSFFCKPSFEDVSFSTRNEERLVAVSLDDYWGFCDRSTGEIVIPCQYDGVFDDFTNGYALVIMETDWEEDANEETLLLIDESGCEVRFPKGVTPFSVPNQAGYCIVMDDSSGLYGIGDVNGTIIMQPCEKRMPELKNMY